MKRRDFLKQGMTVSAGLAFAGTECQLRFSTLDRESARLAGPSGSARRRSPTVRR